MWRRADRAVALLPDVVMHPHIALPIGLRPRLTDQRGAAFVVVAPRRYWRPGAAIAAGAAIGVVTGAAAAALAGTPPQPGQCWYYTSPAKTTGFWDVCPH